MSKLTVVLLAVLDPGLVEDLGYCCEKDGLWEHLAQPSSVDAFQSRPNKQQYNVIVVVVSVATVVQV